MCIKTFTKQDLDILGYQLFIHEKMNFTEGPLHWREGVLNYYDYCKLFLTYIDATIVLTMYVDLNVA